MIYGPTCSRVPKIKSIKNAQWTKICNISWWIPSKTIILTNSFLSKLYFLLISADSVDLFIELEGWSMLSRYSIRSGGGRTEGQEHHRVGTEEGAPLHWYQIPWALERSSIAWSLNRTRMGAWDVDDVPWTTELLLGPQTMFYGPYSMLYEP